ncbi:MAG: hypothetical protein LH618_17255 [Saprospiraceae bacterium]|nr:hypothetical protein [Saprospiraceae bacterium]
MRRVLPRTAPGLLLAWVLVVGIVTNVQAQSPWVRSKAGFYLQAAWQTIPRYAALYSATGDEQPLDRRLTETMLQLYGEYGVTRYTTVVVSLPFRFQQAGAFLQNTPAPLTSSGTLSGLGNASLGLRHSILRGDWPLTGFLRVDLPVNRFNDLAGLRTGYRSLTVLPMLSTGQGYAKAYWFAYAGYALRTRDYNAYTNAGVEAGYHFRKLWAIAFSELMLPTASNNRPDLSANNLRTGLYVHDQGYWSFGLKGIFEIHRFWGLTASAAGAGWGQLVPQRPAFGLGAYFKWD